MPLVSVFFFVLLVIQQEFSDPRDADDARYSLDGREFDGSRIIVEFARGVRTYMLARFCNVVL